MTTFRSKIIGGIAASAVAAVLAGTSAQAADLTYGAATPTPPPAAVETMFDVAFGVTFTSDYISRGYSATDHGAAVQPWWEADYGMFYLGYWGSNIVGDWENDLSIGIRPTWGPVNFDFGYVRYLYSHSSDYGELYAKASISPVEPLTIGGAFYYDPDSENNYVEANASVSLPHDLSASAALGFTNYSGGGSDTSWNAGLSYSPTDWVKLDGRYYGGPDADKFVVSVSFQSSLKKIGILH